MGIRLMDYGYLQQASASVCFTTHSVRHHLLGGTSSPRQGPATGTPHLQGVSVGRGTISVAVDQGRTRRRTHLGPRALELSSAPGRPATPLRGGAARDRFCLRGHFPGFGGYGGYLGSIRVRAAAASALASSPADPASSTRRRLRRAETAVRRVGEPGPNRTPATRKGTSAFAAPPVGASRSVACRRGCDF